MRSKNHLILRLTSCIERSENVFSYRFSEEFEDTGVEVLNMAHPVVAAEVEEAGRVTHCRSLLKVASLAFNSFPVSLTESLVACSWTHALQDLHIIHNL